MNKFLYIFVLCILLALSPVLSLSTLSVSSVDFISNDPTIQGQSFLLTGVSGFDGTSRVRASIIQDGNAQATKDLDISTFSNKHVCEYSFVNPRQVHSRYRVESTWTTNGCFNYPVSANEFVYGSVVLLQFTDKPVKCVIGTATYRVGSISNPIERFETRFRLTNGETAVDSQLITNTQTQAVLRSGNTNIAHINWQGGGLKTPASCPVFTNEMGLQNTDQSTSFIIVNKNYETTYLTLMSNLDTYITGGDLKSTTGLQSRVDAINRHSNNIVPITSTSYSGSPLQIQDVTGQAKKQLVATQPFTLQLFTMRINADFVGVIINTGKPSIVSLSNQIDIKSGVGLFTDVRVRNVGTASGTFRFSAQCQGGIYAIPTNSVFSAGEEKVVRLFFSSNSVNNLDEMCTVKVQDINNMQNVDQKTIRVLSTPTNSFDDDKQICLDANTLGTTQNNQYIRQNCPHGCEQISPGLARCRTIDNKLDDGNGDDTEKVNTGLFVVALFLAFITAIVVAVYTKPLSLFSIGGANVGKWLRIILVLVVFVFVFLAIPMLWSAVLALFTLPTLFG